MSDLVKQVINTAGRVLGRDKRRLRDERTARALLRIFGAFITEDDKIDSRELEITFDFVPCAPASLISLGRV